MPVMVKDFKQGLKSKYLLFIDADEETCPNHFAITLDDNSYDNRTIEDIISMDEKGALIKLL